MIATQSNISVFFMYIAEMYRLDTNDALVIEKHAYDKDRWCITCPATNRALQVAMVDYRTEINHLDANGNICKYDVYNHRQFALQSIMFLTGVTAVV